MRLIIAGSRTWSPSPEEIDAQFDDFMIVKADVTEVVSGGARGGDDAGEAWATINGYPVKRFIAEWDRFGRLAGPHRNRKMARYADMAIVFWKQQSSGSANMVALQKAVKVVLPSWQTADR